MTRLLFLMLLSLNQAPEKTGAAKQNQAKTAPVQIQRDTTPLTVRLLNTGKSENEAAQDSARVEEEREGARTSRALGWITAVVSSLTLIFLAVQTGALQRSITVMREQETRMKETLEQMRTSEERQLRAYVFVDESNWKEKSVEWPNGAAYILRLKNSGQTPAYKCQAWVGTVIAPLDDPPQPPAFVSEASRSTLGPNGGTMLLNTAPRILTDKEIVNVMRGTHAYYVFGHYEFTDAFARKRRGEFRMIRSDSGHGLNHHPEGNYAD